MNPEYFLVLLLILLITLLVEKRHHFHLYHSRKERLEFVAAFLIFGILWDHLAIWRGHWSFPRGGIRYIKIGLMPIEEYLFIFIIPYFVITFYKLIDSKFRKKK